MHKIIDTHAHLDSKQFDEDRNAVINKCLSEGIEYIINPATNYDSCLKVLNLADKFSCIFACLGVHPHDAKEFDNKTIYKIEAELKNKKVIGIGEIGLDYHYNYSPREIQKEVFREFIRFAKKNFLPVVIHNRESDNDMLSILESEADENLFGQFHCFSGTKDLAKRVLDLGFYISLTGSITFPKNNYEDIIREIPVEKLLLETDSPYMSPVPHRGKRNDPSNLYCIIKKISEIMNLSEERIRKITFENTIRLFNLPILNQC